MCRKQKSGCGSKLSGAQNSSQKGNSLRCVLPIVINTPVSTFISYMLSHMSICDV